MRRCSSLILPILFVLSASAVLADDLAGLIDRDVRGNDEARIAVIDAGLPAIPGLVEVIRTQTGVPAERAARAIGWIAEFAADSPDRAKAEWVLVNLLVDRQQPLLARQTAARYLWHVASPDSVPALIRFVGDPDLQTDALWSLQNLPGKRVVNALAGAYRSAKGATKVVVLETLGRRPDAPVGLLTEAVGDADLAVRITALQALASKADLSVASLLESEAAKADGDERTAALLSFVGVGDGVRATDPDAARRIYEKALDMGGDTRPVVLRALEGLGEVGNAETPAVIERFMGRSSPAVQVAAAGALARLPGEGATRVLAAALSGASLQKARPILSALADRADPAAVDAVVPLARVDSTDVRLTALKALGRMGSRAACEVVLESVQDPKAAEEVRKTAFEAYIAIAAAQLKQGNAEAARGIYESALTLAETDDQEVPALSGLAAVGSPQSLPAIEPSLQAEGAVQEAAVGAYMAGAGALTASGDRDAALAAYTKLLDVAKAGPQIAEIVQRLGALGSGIDAGSRNGFITHWWVIGPFPSDKDYNGTDTVFFPEENVDLAAEQKLGNKTLRWRHEHTLDPEGIMDYASMLRPNQNVLCYAYAEVGLDEPAEARLHMGSDDALVVWVNGEEAYRFKGPRSLKVGQDTKDVSLRAGANRILIKVVQGGGDWSSSVQLTDRNDQPLAFEQKTE
jgi:tetratricopeptide (TPR) repeat protein